MVPESIVRETIRLFSERDGFNTLIGDDRTFLFKYEPHLMRGIQEAQEGMLQSGVPLEHVSYWNTGALFATMAFLKAQLAKENQGFESLIEQLKNGELKRQRFVRWARGIILLILVVSLSTAFFLLII